MSKDKKRFAVGTKVWIKMPGAHGVDSIIVVLQGIAVDLRGASSQWVRTSDSQANLREATAIGVARLSVRQPARNT